MSHAGAGAPAVFLDRDGTLVDDPGFLRDPDDVRLLPGVTEALATLERAGYRLVVITNQSGIGRGLLTDSDLLAVNERIGALLAAAGVTIQAWRHCPHLPDDGCACRKPGTALHREVAEELAIDLAASWCVGDRLGDVTAAAALGGRGVLVLTGHGPRHRDEALAASIAVVPDLMAAAAKITASDGD